eukprot:14675-Heterococcus_DN1.PRE.15
MQSVVKSYSELVTAHNSVVISTTPTTTANTATFALSSLWLNTAAQNTAAASTWLAHACRAGAPVRCSSAYRSAHSPRFCCTTHNAVVVCRRPAALLRATTAAAAPAGAATVRRRHRFKCSHINAAQQRSKHDDVPRHTASALA